MLSSSPAGSGIHRQDNYAYTSHIRPSPPPQSPLHSYGQLTRSPLDNRSDNRSNELEEMNSRIARIMTEVSALQAQIQALQPSRSFSNVTASSPLRLDAAAAAATDVLPPYLQS
jgi:hypothetical protein